MNVLSQLLIMIRDAAIFNPDVQVAPACILWPDHDRQWEAVMPRLQGELPELLMLGDYAPEKRVGPAIWLRCVIAGTDADVAVPAGCTPILYLPGVSRQDLRALDTCPDHLKPLAELQYRGVIWSQLNAKDWTILAFLKCDQGGLALDVARDNDARHAMQLALYRLLDEDLALLQGKRLDKDYFNTLLTGGDPIRDLLQWLDQGDAFKGSRGENEWMAFVEVCKSQLAFNPDNAGVLAGAEKLAMHTGPWAAVWQRYCEAPKRYPKIPAQIRKCQTPAFDLFTDADTAGGWPQWNEEQERNLQRDLIALNCLPAHEARKRLQDLEKQHGGRRHLVWADLGEAPLALALEHLALLAKITTHGLSTGTVEEMAAGYHHEGWRADDAVISSLSQVVNQTDDEAITSAIRAVYLPWAEESARHLQQVWQDAIHGLHRQDEKEQEVTQSGCLLFIDGLRFDCARRLAALLLHDGCSVRENSVWAALPSVTGTGKPAVAPIVRNNSIAEEPPFYNFEPLNAYQFKKSMEDNGWQIIHANDPIPSPILSSTASSLFPIVNKMWCEFGDIDHEGHDRGWKLATRLDSLLDEIHDRIRALLAAGWQSVKVVTDHGWLLLPGGLPKIELPVVLVESKWKRCAAIKQGASTEERLFSWFWNPNQHFALADGISCFRKNEEYAHGGLSLQECLTLELTVTKVTAGNNAASLEFTDIGWNNMRCTVAVAEASSFGIPNQDGSATSSFGNPNVAEASSFGNAKTIPNQDGSATFAGLSVDIRMLAGNAESTVAISRKRFNEHGTASVVVEDEELFGKPAMLVLLNADGELMAQAETRIGGGHT